MAGTSPRSTTIPSEIQVNLLVRLRVIQQLQNIPGYTNSTPQLSSSSSEQLVLDTLSWIAQCYALKPSEATALAVSIKPGLLTLHLYHDEESATRTSKLLLSTLRAVFLSDPEDTIGPSSAIGPFFRMVVNTAHLRIQHKLFRVGLTDGTPEETTNRFASLVATWMYYRPEGEQSRGYQRIAFNYGDIRRASEIMVQSFFTIAKQGDADVQCEKMDEDSRFTYLSSIVTACNLLINSTFFHDLHNYEPFQMALNSRDRVFLHKIHRRLTYIASYKTGAAKLAFLGIPFLRQLLGESGIADFVNGRGGVQVELVKQSTPASSTRLYRWPSQNPDEYLRSMFNLPLDEESSPSSPCHSRVTSDNSRYSFGSTSTDSSSGVRSELSLLDSQLRSELLHSQAVSEAWIPDLTMTVKSHPELQLIHYLEYCGIDVACQAIGTSKPTCWMCSKYVECLNVDAQDSEGEAHGETAPRPEWFLNQNAGKIRCDWMVPSMAKEEVMEMVVEEVQRELENVMQEVALDCCF